MILKKDSTNDKIKNDLDWKEKNKKYLSHLQKFLDATDSIEREDIKSNVIAQMLKFIMDMVLVKQLYFQLLLMLLT